MEITYHTVDVFTNRQFGGNPLAVIPDARGISSAQMQQIAAEFNYSETTFVLPPADPQHTANVRIFTPTLEVPFAGHPNVGTAFVLASQGVVFGRPVQEHMIFEEEAGLVTVDVSRDGDSVVGASISAPQPLAVGPQIPAELVAACVSLDARDVAVDTHLPRRVSVGLAFTVAELAAREALARARPNPAGFEAAAHAFPDPQMQFALFLYVPLDATRTTFATRMFAPLDNVFEDPATGSASAALAAFQTTLTPRDDGTHPFVVMQGEDMGRPSRIEATVRVAAGQPAQVSVGGSCVPVMRGVLTLFSQPKDR
jgi:trans-2,3-dihydro-3-hydroxyanthranilate isomerase